MHLQRARHAVQALQGQGEYLAVNGRKRAEQGQGEYLAVNGRKRAE
jgi:hypothetical protein